MQALGAPHLGAAINMAGMIPKHLEVGRHVMGVVEDLGPHRLDAAIAGEGGRSLSHPVAPETKAWATSGLQLGGLE